MSIPDQLYREMLHRACDDGVLMGDGVIHASNHKWIDTFLEMWGEEPIEHFIKRLPAITGVPPTRPNYTYVRLTTNATHYIAVVIYMNYPQAADNGYVLNAWDKAVWSKEAAHEAMGDFMRRIGLNTDTAYFPDEPQSPAHSR